MEIVNLNDYMHPTVGNISVAKDSIRFEQAVIFILYHLYIYIKPNNQKEGIYVNTNYLFR